MVAPDLPAGFIGRDDRTAADGRAQRLVGGLRLTRRAVGRMDQAAARDGEPEPVPQEIADLAEGEPELFIEDHRQRDGLRAELHGGRAQRVGRLQRMAALDAAVTPPALADRHAKLVDDGPLHRQIFLDARRSGGGLPTHHSPDTRRATARRA